VALAEALTVNTTLRKVIFSATSHLTTFGAQSYEAFAAILRVNTNLILKFPRLDTAVRDETLVNHYNQMRIEQHRFGRGRLLASNQTTREEWVDALYDLSCSDFVDVGLDDSPELRVGCLYSLLLQKPDIAVA
jgi:hypothetical protein